jgi:hypothetical protein
MAMSEHLIWFLAGLVPYYVKWEHFASGGWTLEVRALSWTLKIEDESGGSGGWTLRVLLIERLKDAIWAAVLRFSGKTPTL